MLFWVVHAGVLVDHHSLGCSLLSYQQHSFLLLGNGVDQKLCPHVVHIGYKDGEVLGGDITGIGVFLHLCVPVHPGTCL